LIVALRHLQESGVGKVCPLWLPFPVSTTFGLLNISDTNSFSSNNSSQQKLHYTVPPTTFPLTNINSQHENVREWNFAYAVSHVKLQHQVHLPVATLKHYSILSEWHQAVRPYTPVCEQIPCFKHHDHSLKTCLLY